MLRLSILLILLTMPLGNSAFAQRACGLVANMRAQLSNNYGETRRSVGFIGTRVLIETWASDETGSWTLLEIYPNGNACVMRVGNHYREYPPEIPGDDT